MSRKYVWLTTILIAASLLGSCAPKLDQTPITPIAPTVRKPAPVAHVDLAPVRDSTRQVGESNRQLSNELTKNRSLVFDLRRQLQAAEVSAVVTPEQWAGLRDRADELEASRAELETINADQRESITRLNDSLIDAVTNTQLVQSALTETQAALDDANLNIAALNTINQTFQKERDAAIKAVSESAGTIAEIRKSRTRWMLTAGCAVACSLGLAYLLFKP